MSVFYLFVSIVSGNTIQTGWISTVDLLIKLDCSVNKKILFALSKAADLN